MDTNSRFYIQVLGVRVYCPNERGNPHYWKDITRAAGRMLVTYGARRDAGSSTGILWLARWALDNLPEPYRSRIGDEYNLILTDKAAERARTDDPDTPRLQPFGHTPAT